MKRQSARACSLDQQHDISKPQRRFNGSGHVDSYRFGLVFVCIFSVSVLICNQVIIFNTFKIMYGLQSNLLQQQHSPPAVNVGKSPVPQEPQQVVLTGPPAPPEQRRQEQEKQSHPANALPIQTAPQDTTRTNSHTVGQINFLHIPKTGGTTMELLSKKHNHICGFWGSRMVGNQTLQKQHGGFGHFWMQKALGTDNTCWCAEWHMPPALLAEPIRSQLYPADHTFCIIRHPVQKVVSQIYYRMSHPSGERRFGPCHNSTVAYFNEKIYETLTRTKRNVCYEGCHPMPQREFLQGHEKFPNHLKTMSAAGAFDTPTKQCDEILLLNEHFSTEFDALMEKYQCPIRYGDMKASNQRGVKKCHSNVTLYADESKHLAGTDMVLYTEADFEPRVYDLVYKLYGYDIELYERLEEQQKARLASVKNTSLVLS